MTTVLELKSQFSNPSDVTTVLMIIGGDVVQKALAQSTGTLFTPVCFSFGWVSFSYTSLMSILGDGRLLPAPDHPVKVFNLASGYVRENKHWVVGRILRDHERALSRDFRLSGNGVRIAVFEAGPRREKKGFWDWKGGIFKYGRMHVFGAVVMAAQLGIAAVPIGLEGDWGVMLITAAGTALALWFGSLEQWRVEKLPNRRQSASVFALTSGNGSRDIMVIKGLGNCLDLEELATTDTPRNGGPWERLRDEKWRNGKKFRTRRSLEGGKMPAREGSFVWRPRDYMHGVPVGFVHTFLVCVMQSVLWLLLLITVAALKTNTWYLVGVGALGMFQNGMVAAWERRPEDRGLVLKRRDVILTRKVMDGLMDLEAQHGCGAALVPEFFPGLLHPDEEAWWSGKRDPYDDHRCNEEIRGPPRSRQTMPTEKSKIVSRELWRVGFRPTVSFGASVPETDSPPDGELHDYKSELRATSGMEMGGSTSWLSRRKASERQKGEKYQPSFDTIVDDPGGILSIQVPKPAAQKLVVSKQVWRNHFTERESPDWS